MMKNNKIVYCLCFYLIRNILLAQNSLELKETWTLRIEQSTNEEFIFNELTNNQDKSFSTSIGLLSSNDTLRYNNGKIFRTCNISNNRLNGNYLIYYPNGQLYTKQLFSEGYQKDTSVFYSSSGVISKQIIYLTEIKYITLYYSEKGTLKKKTTSVYKDFPSKYIGGTKYTNLNTKEKREYYDYQNNIISKDEYYKIYGDIKQNEF